MKGISNSSAVHSSSQFGDCLAVESMMSIAVAVAMAVAITTVSAAVSAVTMTMAKAKEEGFGLSLWGSLSDHGVEEEADHGGKNDAGDVLHGV